MVISFKYLGRVLLVADDEWMTVIRNLVKARTVWWIMSKILSREGARPQIYVCFFKSIIQLVLLFDADSWGGYTPHGLGPEGVPGPYDKATEREALMTEYERKMLEHHG